MLKSNQGGTNPRLKICNLSRNNRIIASNIFKKTNIKLWHHSLKRKMHTPVAHLDDHHIPVDEILEDSRIY